MARRPTTDPAPRRPVTLPSRALWALIIAGFAVRLLLACTTWGTVDTISYIRFAFSIDQVGLLQSYADNPLYNHPPLPALLSWLALLAAGRNGLAFAAVYRIPVVLADFATAMLLRKILISRGSSPQAALAVSAMYAWNPCALLISGYHFNTDPVIAMLSLLAVYLLGDRGRPFVAGLVLGLAINIKLIPVLLIPPLLFASRSRRDAIGFLGGLALLAIPYLPPLLMEPAFARHVLGYKSSPDPWGILFLLRLAFPAGISDAGEVVAPNHPAILYNRVGAWIVLACAIGWGALARRAGRFDSYRVAAATYAMLLVLAPGFGVQYLVLVAGFFYLTAPRAFANLYGVVCGVFLLAAYFYYWDGTFPISSLFNRPFPNDLAFFGLMPWCLLIYFLAVITPRGAVKMARAT